MFDMKSTNKLALFSLISAHILIAGIVGIKAIRSPENDIKSVYLFILLALNVLFIYIINKKMESANSKWGVKILFLPTFILVLYSSYKVLPIGNPNFSILNNVLILLFYFQLLFLSGVIAKRESK